jgi:hypothetical protein
MAPWQVACFLKFCKHEIKDFFSKRYRDAVNALFYPHVNYQYEIPYIWSWEKMIIEP